MFRNYVNLVKNLSIIHVTGTQNVFFARTLTFFTRVPLNQYNQNLQTLHKNSIESFRHKSKFPKKQQSQETTTDSYDSDEDKDEIKDKYSKVLTINVTSMRVDAILKTALGMSRNKIETEFYENKIRINGTKVAKKSAEVYAGDEIDLIKGPDIRNPDFVIVARIEILSVKPDEDSIAVKVRRCKSLTIEAP